MFNIIDGVPVFGQLESPQVLEQIKRCSEKADSVALMADHHVGYSMPIGGVAAYENYVSPSGVGYDIACGNKAIKTNLKLKDVQDKMPQIMDEVWNTISFGVGRKNQEVVEHELFDSATWRLEAVFSLKRMAAEQLGTVGSGNHYVDIFVDENDSVWIGVHFGSRGLGHKTATWFVNAAGSKDSMDAPPTLFDVNTKLGQEYIECMLLCGQYAYAGRDWVCQKVANILGAEIVDEVHNHHNFAWLENHRGKDLWVVRKGATPAFPGQRGFVGGSMGENSVILEGVENTLAELSLYSTVHGAGRVLSRTKASGRKKWKRNPETGRRAQLQLSGGLISREMMDEWVSKAGVELRGAGTDESPHCYKRLNGVLEAHKGTIKILHTLRPLGVAMASPEEFDPFKD